MEEDINQAQGELDVLKFKMREKEHDIKINSVKIKELKRGMPYRLLKPLSDKYTKTLKTKSKVELPTNYGSARKNASPSCIHSLSNPAQPRLS